MISQTPKPASAPPSSATTQRTLGAGRRPPRTPPTKHSDPPRPRRGAATFYPDPPSQRVQPGVQRQPGQEGADRHQGAAGDGGQGEAAFAREASRLGAHQRTDSRSSESPR